MRILKRLWSYGRFLKRHAEKIFIKNVKGFTRVWKNRFYFCKMIMCEYTLIPEWWRVLYNIIQFVNYKRYFMHWISINSACLSLCRALNRKRNLSDKKECIENIMEWYIHCNSARYLGMWDALQAEDHIDGLMMRSQMSCLVSFVLLLNVPIVYTAS